MASRTSRSQSATRVTAGFSTSTCLPASSMSSIRAACSGGSPPHRPPPPGGWPPAPDSCHGRGAALLVGKGLRPRLITGGDRHHPAATGVPVHILTKRRAMAPPGNPQRSGWSLDLSCIPVSLCCLPVSHHAFARLRNQRISSPQMDSSMVSRISGMPSKRWSFMM